MSIITSGLGTQYLVTQGYGLSLFGITKTLFETLLISPNLSTKWDAVRTYFESIKQTDTLIHAWEAHQLLNETAQLVSSTFHFFPVITEKITEVISHFIPKRRKKITQKIPVLGDLFLPIEKPLLVEGNPFHVSIVTLPILGDLVTPIQTLTPLIGFPFSQTETRFVLIGDLSERVTLHLETMGTLSSKFELRLSCTGEKDFKKVLWEILEEEENGDE